MALVIKKRVSLEFLGDEYKDAVLVFRSIPAKDLPEIVKQTEEADNDIAKVIPLFLGVLSKYFIEGKTSEGDVTREDIQELDSETIVTCFQIVTGQALDPKVNGQSTSSSGTESEPAQT